MGLVCLIDGKPAVLIADLPDHEDETFQLVRYGIYALKESNNNGLRFRGFRVPKANLLRPAKGDGLTVAYHGLNLGRVALCANAAGTMRVMLANMLPWAAYRKTYGAAIGSRELVRRRIGRLAALIVGADAIVDWCAWLLDQGYRGEMECIIAKIFGSESQKEAAIELFMKTHGGRAFLHGHLFGDNVHEYLAPCIYEGEGEMLGMAFLKSLIKEHGKRFFEPIGKALVESGIKKPNMANPAHLWALRKAMAPYAKWRASEMMSSNRAVAWPEGMDERLKAHARFAADGLAHARMEVSKTMVKHQLKLPDRQCRMSELSSRIQDLVVMLTTAMWASAKPEGLIRDAADILCQDLARKLTGKRPSDSYFRAVTKLGEKIEGGGFAEIAGIEPEAILMPYGPPTHLEREHAMSGAFSLEERDDKVAVLTFDLPGKKVNTLGRAVLVRAWRGREGARDPDGPARLAVPQRQARPVHRRGRPDRAWRIGDGHARAGGRGHRAGDDALRRVCEDAVPHRRAHRRRVHGGRHRVDPGDGCADRLRRAAHQDRLARGEDRAHPRLGRDAEAASPHRRGAGHRHDYHGRAGHGREGGQARDRLRRRARRSAPRCGRSPDRRPPGNGPLAGGSEAQRAAARA